MKNRNFILFIASLGIICILFILLLVNGNELRDLRNANEELKLANTALSEYKDRIENIEDEVVEDEEVLEENVLLDKLVNQIEDLIRENEILKNENQLLKTDMIMTLPFDELSLRIIAEKGISDINTILEDLNNNNDLIPYEGVLGGTMTWWPTESILLNERWVLGYFEDGHINGYGLLHYKIDEGMRISWELLDAFLFGEED
ncbi:hypothetical protein EDC18_10478 [Natranaerovirga pectinivora]|uniref:Uncharacterized protein n=1 Tax=Natranaerovirga pectinivora TaxID=682400 RepID=A0A4R3MQT8_9FIRM|nr:hypothetical protein [Natranaerovirga pectinivora]TCT14928.1 hypothetical protein EDC18_10478 [Natranaerovirga pectinivora]